MKNNFPYAPLFITIHSVSKLHSVSIVLMDIFQPTKQKDPQTLTAESGLVADRLCWPGTSFSESRILKNFTPFLQEYLAPSTPAFLDLW